MRLETIKFVSNGNVINPFLSPFSALHCFVFETSAGRGVARSKGGGETVLEIFVYRST